MIDKVFGRTGWPSQHSHTLSCTYPYSMAYTNLRNGIIRVIVALLHPQLQRQLITSSLLENLWLQLLVQEIVPSSCKKMGCKGVGYSCTVVVLCKVPTPETLRIDLGWP